MKFNLYYEDLESTPVDEAQTTLAGIAVVLLGCMYALGIGACLLVYVNR